MKKNTSKYQIKIAASLFALCYFFLTTFPASAQLDLPSFLNPFQQQTKSSVPLPAITANDLSLVWTTNTYTPPDYIGKPLPAYNSVVEILALPTSQTKTNLSSLVYKWYLDDQFQEYNSGENLMRFLFRTSVLGGQQHYIDLKIEDKEGRSVLNLSTIINIVSPQAIIYPIENQTTNFIAGGTPDISNILFAITPLDEQANLSPDQEKTFIAVPYFFSATQPGNLSFQWTFDGQTINKTEEKDKFSLKVASGAVVESFTKNLSVLIVNPLEEIQRAVGQIEIIIKK